MNKLTVTIEGSSGSGKSTLAALLQRWLMGHGCPTTITDDATTDRLLDKASHPERLKQISVEIRTQPRVDRT